ncbi:hypothetical protein LGM57_22175 [Burkholderia cepacia]|uniref:P-loop ATPase, Sll1717 family n=1 Tax=Burkholderia cepacia TaxID=292 RepID=UPI001C950CD4|nr:hypothetical protein [Burkholderia cepacia]MBY4800141.1 hypothetical protein [Burkholderia cepacia]MCA7979034.1 hypothetical protein [Burkholderia cepacia]MCA8329235.1 hypothetical protein [Burkholderia cepacia]
MNATTWKSLNDLQEPFNDAVNYKTRKQREFFNKIFLRTDDLAGCLQPSVYFLIGEKGSGKTAYAAYLEANELNSHRCKLTTMTESQYKRFIELKRDGKLAYSDYANIWRPMLLNMVCQAIVEKSKGFLAGITGKFKAIEQEINKFNKEALNPEVEVAFEMIREVNFSAEVGKEKVAKGAAERKSKSTDTTEKIKHHLLETEGRIKAAIADISLKNHHVIFVDGIDYRPESVAYKDYIECIKGLGEATWQLNNDFFGDIRDSKGRIKIVLLVRPDVFHALNLYNSNSRLQDNSVFLDWATTENALRSSRLYEAAGKFFSSQQAFAVDSVSAADQYFVSSKEDAIFRRLLKNSFQKPRDVLTFIRIAKRITISKRAGGSLTFFPSDIGVDSDFTREYSDYLLGEIRNYAAFYMHQSDFASYLKFFQYFNGNSSFDFDRFSSAFENFSSWAGGESIANREYLRDPEALLQFFYDVNLIGYRESALEDSDRFFHWSYRERSLNNLSPKIKTSGVLMINPGVAKALDIGKRTKPTNAYPPSKRRKYKNLKGRNAKAKIASTPHHGTSQKLPNSAPGLGGVKQGTNATNNLSEVTRPPRRNRSTRRPKKRTSPPNSHH